MAAILLTNGISITDLQEQVLLDVFVDLAAAEEWLKSAIQSKGLNRADRLIMQWIPVLLEDSSITQIPGTRAGLLNLIFSHPDYKTRAERDTIPTP